ncbi:MAG: UDP-glucose/GDP-mannose dehydrogenase family protein [Bacteroidales bacterium]|nr:UDP-glucose/GDP-mannose dehydrogenase family protein [Bacteroidales bacterium]MDD2425945.1 UDP-glucose/GDP-mannose dehydrogenase family protein [Bacteroidales bacterium]MDD3989184.1 UDP-glucose/GDP-mannose dehydrogenase family protein [Bacteroidales bacterium]
MKIAMVGTGYVGLVTGACFAEMGLNVVCVDTDKEKIGKLNEGIMPIYEPGIEELVRKNANEKRLSFSVSLKEILEDVNIVFAAVGTPPDEDGSADIRYVLDVAAEVGRNMSSYKLFVTKSTVPVGTAKKVKEVIERELARRGVNVDIDVASNPEFLKEGAAIKDFMNPDRVVVGVENERAQQLLERLYKPFVLNGFPIIFMDVESAEVTKYAANAMLATRISFMNEIAALCELTGANVDNVRRGIGSDKRIGNSFLYAGAGYGGSCFPKDVKALIKTAREHNLEMRIISATEDVNSNQKRVVFEKLLRAFGNNLKGKVIAIWGLSYKPDTDDMREATSLVVIEELLKAGAVVKVYDPVAMEECHKKIGDSVVYAENSCEAARGADALALITEWKQFRLPDWKKLRSVMRGNIIVDGRNIYDPAEIKAEGFIHYSIGKKS